MSINIASYSKLGMTPVDPSGLPFVEPSKFKPYYRIYNDGGHYVASLCAKKNRDSHRRSKTELTELDLLFDCFYFEATKQGLKDKKLFNYIKAGLELQCSNIENLDKHIEEKIEQKLHNLYLRKKRFRRKAYFNNWNYFVTFTYDDELCTETTFRQKLRRCLSNLHTRHNWRYMGVFERAPDTGRLHFHGIFYIPEGEMVGKIVKQIDYSVVEQKLKVCFNNTFFSKRFGRADFRDLRQNLLKNGEAIGYILKYIHKDNGRIIYSRGVASELCKQLPDTELVSEFMDFVAKYVLYDDVIDWERDVMHFSPKQLSFFKLKSPPLAS